MTIMAGKNTISKLIYFPLFLVVLSRKILVIECRISVFNATKSGSKTDEAPSNASIAAELQLQFDKCSIFI